MIPVVRVAFSSPVAIHGHLPARRTLPRQPLTLLPIGLAFRAGTWDKNNHDGAKVGLEPLPAKAHCS